MKQILRVHDQIADLNQAVATQLTRILCRACRLRQEAFILLSGGSTPTGVYKVLAQTKYADKVPWNSIHFFWGDERCVPPEDPESNFRNAYDHFLNDLPVDPKKIHRIKGELNPHEAALEYAEVLSKFSEADHPWPIFDVAVMGMGEDGHTASLFPGIFNPREQSDAVVQVSAAYQDRPVNRVTLTPMVFNTSRNVIFLVVGEAKAEMLQKVIMGKKDLLNIPVQRIRPVKGNLTWHIDSAAAKFL